MNLNRSHIPSYYTIFNDYLIDISQRTACSCIICSLWERLTLLISNSSFMCVSGVDINIDIWGMTEQILTQYTWSYGFWWAITMNLLGVLSWFIFLVSSFNLNENWNNKIRYKYKYTQRKVNDQCFIRCLWSMSSIFFYYRKNKSF